MKKVLFLLAILAGCSSESTTDRWRMELPAHFNTKQASKFLKLLPDSVRDKSFTKALLYESNGVKTYLTIPMPVFEFSMFIQTTDADGKEIENLMLINAFTDENISDVTIGADRTITAIDTTFALVFDSLGNESDEVKMMSVSRRAFRITEAGTIEEIEEPGL